MHYLIPAFSFYNNRTTIAMFNGLVQIFKFFNKDPEELPEDLQAGLVYRSPCEPRWK